MFDIDSPTFWRIDNCRRSIIFSIDFRRSSRFESFVSKLDLRSMFFSSFLFNGPRASATTCSDISVTTSELDPEDAYDW